LANERVPLDVVREEREINRVGNINNSGGQRKKGISDV
jgi:hypothetical protein